MFGSKYLTYRSSDGSLYVHFWFVKLRCRRRWDWRIYILSPIDFHGRSEDFSATHRLQGEEDLHPRVCWTREIESLSEAKTVAALWADCIALYIQSQKSFDEIARQLIQERRNSH